jgi:hypothetical protein
MAQREHNEGDSDDPASLPKRGIADQDRANKIATSRAVILKSCCKAA